MGLRFYDAVRWLIGLALGFYFRHIERFHPERVPAAGPILFTSNHPNSLTDSFVIGSALPRKINFVATVALFRIKPVKWLLRQCGVIPINRVKDDPKAMHTVAETFEACFRVLEQGEAVGIFPEGITYDDEQLKPVKSGAARLALELEHRHDGKLGLQIVPVGLTYSAKEKYRSDVLVNFGEPIRVADFLENYLEKRKECIARLTAQIEHGIQALIVHLPELAHGRVIAGVKRLYRDHRISRLGTNYPGRQQGTEELSAESRAVVMNQRIVEAVKSVFQTDPARAASFAAKLAVYERWLERLRISDNSLALASSPPRLVRQDLLWALLAFLGAPVALYGWVHRAIPYALVTWAASRFAEPGKKKAQRSTVAILGGIVVFGFFYGTFILIAQLLFGWPRSFWYGLSLPPASLAAHYYAREMRRFAASIRNTWLLAHAPFAARRLLRLRQELLDEIEFVRREKNSTVAVPERQ